MPPPHGGGFFHRRSTGIFRQFQQSQAVEKKNGRASSMKLGAHILKAILFCAAVVSVSLAFTDEELQRYERQSRIQGDLHTADSIITRGAVEHLDFTLSDFQLASLDAEQLLLLRNSIFARYGYAFTDSVLTEHFMSFPWYAPAKDDVSEDLAPVDEWNIRRIRFYEESQTEDAGEMPDESHLVGFWHGSAAVGSGYSRRFFFFPDGRFIYRENSMDGSRRLIEISGKWELQVSHLVLKADSATYLEGGMIIEPYASYGSDFVIEHAMETGIDLAPPVVFRLPLTDFIPDYAASHPETDLDHLTVPFMGIGTREYWRICGDPFGEHLH